MNIYIIYPTIRTKGQVIGAGDLFDASAPIYVAIVCITKIYKNFLDFCNAKIVINFSILLSTSINI